MLACELEPGTASVATAVSICSTISQVSDRRTEILGMLGALTSRLVQKRKKSSKSMLSKGVALSLGCLADTARKA